MQVRIPAYSLEIAEQAATLLGTSPGKLLGAAVNVTALREIEGGGLSREPSIRRAGAGKPRLESPLVQTHFAGVHSSTRAAVVATAKRMHVSKARLLRALADRHLGQFLRV
jgi:hypothetical protein